MPNGMVATQSSISVVVRVRPLEGSIDGAVTRLDKDHADYNQLVTFDRYHLAAQKGSDQSIIQVVDDKMLVFGGNQENLPLVPVHANRSLGTHARTGSSSRFREHKFIFDRVYRMDAAQADIYEETARPLMDAAMTGYNVSIFAYGATGCGKTHTVMGTHEDPGIISRTINDIYGRIEASAPQVEINVTVSYLEIYNETIYDLLAPKDAPPQLLEIRESSNKSTIVSKLSYRSPKTLEEALELIDYGNCRRRVSNTHANAVSSRSHAVLQLFVTQRDKSGIDDKEIESVISIIDLAGSERAAATRNRGLRLQEGANINRSLLALGNCIKALSETRRNTYVPYRDSKLTRLLKFSLGGNCKTAMIVCVSPSSAHYDETLNTLHYADRAKNIKTKIIRNRCTVGRHVSTYMQKIVEQQATIEALEKRLAVALRQQAQPRQDQMNVHEMMNAAREATFAIKNIFLLQSPRRLRRRVRELELARCRFELEQLRDMYNVYKSSALCGLTSRPLAEFEQRRAQLQKQRDQLIPLEEPDDLHERLEAVRADFLAQAEQRGWQKCDLEHALAYIDVTMMFYESLAQREVSPTLLCLEKESTFFTQTNHIFVDSLSRTLAGRKLPCNPRNTPKKTCVFAGAM